jgi:hypothetical protein
MKIKAVKYGAVMRQRGATGNTDCWDDKDTSEIDLDLLTFRLNATLNKAQRDAAMPVIEAFFREGIGHAN